jgi:hypothetical protein
MTNWERDQDDRFGEKEVLRFAQDDREKYSGASLRMTRRSILA